MMTPRLNSLWRHFVMVIDHSEVIPISENIIRFDNINYTLDELRYGWYEISKVARTEVLPPVEIGFWKRCIRYGGRTMYKVAEMKATKQHPYHSNSHKRYHYDQEYDIERVDIISKGDDITEYIYVRSRRTGNVVYRIKMDNAYHALCLYPIYPYEKEFNFPEDDRQTKTRTPAPIFSIRGR
jgi:hypothetical protein